MDPDKFQNSDRVAIIACQVMEPEFEKLRRSCPHLETFYLDQNLHRTPNKMADLVQEKVDQASDKADRVVLGYGLCSNGIVGVTARQQGLIVPRCHDCIAFFLGSPKTYLEDFHSRPGSYYLTPGWIAERKDPLGIIEEEYVPRYGRETAEWAKREELKHYTHIVLVDTGAAAIEPLREVAMENARFFNMEYVEIEGKSADFFKKLAKGPYDPEEFIQLEPGEKVTQEMFIG